MKKSTDWFPNVSYVVAERASQEHWHPSKGFMLKAEGQAGQADTTALISEFV